jgi:hypothetical protein
MEFTVSDQDNKPEPEIRGGNRPADFISSKGNREPSKETHSLVDEDSGDMDPFIEEAENYTPGDDE